MTRAELALARLRRHDRLLTTEWCEHRTRSARWRDRRLTEGEKAAMKEEGHHDKATE